MDKNHWAYAAVEYCYEQGIVGGVSPILFGRDEPIRRGDFVLMLYAALGKPAVSTPCTFQDVSASDYYCTALAWGQANGVASGTGNGCFSPNAQITREQAFTILRQALPLMDRKLRGFAAPCGVCRQVMAEFCDPETFRIVLMNGDGEIRDYLLKELLPLGFTGKALEK